MGAAYLAGDFSGRQPATVAMDVGLSAIRVIGLLLVLFWCQEFVGKEIDRRTVFLGLSYPAPRSAYLLGRYVGLAVLTGVAIVVLGLLLLSTVVLWEHRYLQATEIEKGVAFVTTLAFIALDLAVIGAFGLLVASISTTPLLPMALGFAFALSARSLGPALEFLLGDSGAAKELRGTMLPLLDAFRWIIPDLSRLDIRTATLYGQWPPISSMVGGALMALGYIAVMLSAAVALFSRRQFN